MNWNIFESLWEMWSEITCDVLNFIDERKENFEKVKELTGST